MKKTFHLYILGALIIVSIAIILLINAGFHFFSKKQIEDQILHDYKTHINLFSFYFERMISERYGDIEKIANFLSDKNYSREKVEIILSRRPCINYILLLNKDGTVKDTFPKKQELIGIDLSYSPFYKNAEKLKFSGPYVFLIDKQPYYVMSKVTSDKIVLAFLNIPGVNSVLEILKREGIYAFIVNQKGAVLFHTDERIVKEGTNWSDLDFVKKGISGVTELIEGEIEGERYIFKAEKVPTSDGVIFIGMPYHKAFSVILILREKMLLVLLFSVILSVAISLILSKGLLRPVKKILKMIQKIKEGNYNVTPYESGLEELDIVSYNISEMAKSIYDRELKLKKIFESSLDAIVLSTPDGDILDINDAGIKMFGFENKEEALKIKTWQVYENISQRLSLLKELESKGYVKDFEVIFKRRNDKNFYGLTSSTIVRDKNGGILFLVTTVKDITEKRKLQEQLFQSQKLESIGRLTGSIAHDFNNILSMISGSNQLIQMITKDNPQIQRHTETISRGVDRAKDFIKKLLVFTKSQPMEFKVYDINELIKEEIKILKPTIREDISLEFEPFDKPLPVSLDRTQFTQILLNLTVNSIDAMPYGGMIKIVVEHKKFDADSIRVYPFAKAGDYACISFTDTGTGIPRDIIDKIFDPFFTTKSEGTGLGLATVYSIVQQHRGFINVYSEEGKGTTFRIYLPLTEQLERVTEESEQDIPIEIKNILIVEDNHEVREVVEEMLKSIGLNVISFSDGFEALEKFKEIKEQIDLCLFDVVMPSIGGVELYKKFSEIKPDVKILFMTGYANNVAQINALIKEGMKILNKPFTIYDFKKKISEIK
jgi:PAS domain S-box-containing protein